MAEQRATQLKVVSQSAINREQRVERVALFGDDGLPRVLPKEAAARADAAALTSAAATGGDAPTEAEYNALRTDVSNLRTAFNDLLAKLRTADVIST